MLIQRVARASVQVEEAIVGEIGQGLLVFLGVEEEDDEEDVHWLVRKLISMRIFSDEQGKMNLSINQVGGQVLCVSQFTLHASTRKGKRPSFIRAASPQKAEELYLYFQKCIQDEGIATASGSFGTHMQVKLLNDGPVTIWMDSKNKE